MSRGRRILGFPPWKAAVAIHMEAPEPLGAAHPGFPALFQVAIIAGNFELAEIIKTHKESDVGELDFSRFSRFSPFPWIPGLDWGSGGGGGGVE